MSEKETDQKDSRRRILEAAEGVFAEKGFDGARVDEIAHRAGVNKALIYYYFKSKEEILNVLFQKLIEDVFALQDFSRIEELINSPKAIRELLKRFLDYFSEHQKLLRIFFMEVLKDYKENNFAESFFKGVIKIERESMERSGLTFPDEQKMLVFDFFTAMMPMFSYITFKDLWCRSFGVAAEELEENFLSAFMDTHVARSLQIMKNPSEA